MGGSLRDGGTSQRTRIASAAREGTIRRQATEGARVSDPGRNRWTVVGIVLAAAAFVGQSLQGEVTGLSITILVVGLGALAMLAVGTVRES